MYKGAKYSNNAALYINIRLLLCLRGRESRWRYALFSSPKKHKEKYVGGDHVYDMRLNFLAMQIILGENYEMFYYQSRWTVITHLIICYMLETGGVLYVVQFKYKY